MTSRNKSSSPEDEQPVHIIKSRHIKFLYRLLHVLPEAMTSLETSRMTLAYFSISGLDVLGGLDELDQQKKKDIVDWIYSLQSPKGGFQGSSFLKLGVHAHGQSHTECGALESNNGHVAMTYTALATLVILGDDFSRLDKAAITSGLSQLQQDNGSFVASLEESENDMRFIFCAAAVSYMIQDWSGFDKEKATKFIISSLRYDGAFAQCPDMESHGGSTYCALAALSLMGTLHMLTKSQISQITRWCLFRLNDGFQGRPNKPDDTCYTFWVGASLTILCGSEPWVCDIIAKSGRYVFRTQDPIVGGLSKWPDETPDPLHTYLGLAGLSLSQSVDGLLPVHPALNITQRAINHLQTINGGTKLES